MRPAVEAQFQPPLASYIPDQTLTHVSGMLIVTVTVPGATPAQDKPEQFNTALLEDVTLVTIGLIPVHKIHEPFTLVLSLSPFLTK
jgi:hypothetical protein